MTMLAIQFISARALRAAGDCDADWQTVEPVPGVDYSDPASVTEAMGWLDQDVDGLYRHRIIEIETAAEDVLDPLTKCVSRAIVVVSERIREVA